MGTPKACLEWYGSTLLYRAAALLRRTVNGPVVVVVGDPAQARPRTPAGSSHPARGVRGAPEGCEVDPEADALWQLPAGVVLTHDPTPGLGPLQGIAAGLAAVGDAADAAFVCATDMPFLHPAFIRRVLNGLDDADVALPFALGHRQPLAAAYRVGLAEPVAALLAAGGRTPGELYARSRVTVLDEAALRADPTLARLDPGLESLTNVNTPAEYAAARARTPAPVVLEHRGVRHTVHAATLAAAVDAIGGDRNAATVLNGDPAAPDPHLPLVAGDTLVVR
ncbi:MAG: NTP transferase domain-containing protein [Pseudonocardia sp.]|nr:NTP transferase domain-containing protein [Pseudonocardia sp.]